MPSLREPLERHVAQELYIALRRAESRLDVDIEVTLSLVEAAVSVKRLSQEKDLRSDDGLSYAVDDSDAEQPLDPVVAHATPTVPAATPSLAHSSFLYQARRCPKSEVAWFMAGDLAVDIRGGALVAFDGRETLHGTWAPPSRRPRPRYPLYGLAWIVQ